MNITHIWLVMEGWCGGHPEPHTAFLSETDARESAVKLALDNTKDGYHYSIESVNMGQTTAT